MDEILNETNKLKLLYYVLLQNGFNFDNPPLSDEQLTIKVVKDLQREHRRRGRKDKLIQIMNRTQ